MYFEWKQIGNVINSQNNTNLTVEFVSEGQAALGNDSAIDEILLNEINACGVTLIKTASVSSVDVGETVTYTITISNTYTRPMAKVEFQDIVPDGLLFVPGSVMVNNAKQPAADPNTGFSLPDIDGGKTSTVTFDAMFDFVPTVSPALCIAKINYYYTQVEGGIPVQFEKQSNEIPIIIGNSADLSVVKESAPNNVEPGNILAYAITVENAGPSSAENVILSDPVPVSVLQPEFSIDGGENFYLWPGSLELGTMESGESKTVIISGVVDPNLAEPIVNVATVTSNTLDPNLTNNMSAFTTNDISTVKVNNTATDSNNTFEIRCQAISDVIESVVLQEAALSHILNTGGESIQAVLNTECMTAEQLVKFNEYATRLIESITRLEMMLQAKLKTLFDGFGDCDYTL